MSQRHAETPAPIPEAWAAGRQATSRWSWCPRTPQPLPSPLAWRSVRVIPTAHGLFFIVTAIVAGVLPIRYSSAAAFAWAAFLWLGMAKMLIRSHRNVANVQLTKAATLPAYAGGRATVLLTFSARREARYGLYVDGGSTLESETDAGGATARRASFDVEPFRPTTVHFHFPVPTRGIFRLGRMRLHSIHPLGLALSLRWLWPDHVFVVYPQPEVQGPSPPAHGGARTAPSTQRAQTQPDSDVSLLRAYRTGDGARRISWKASARHQRLLTRDAPPAQRGTVVLAWRDTANLEREHAVSRMTRWVIEADRAGGPYALDLHGSGSNEAVLGPSLGPNHLHACLTALARVCA